MVITLNTTSFKHGTFGVLRADDFSCATVERPWLLNERRVSCIPAGRYVLRKRRSGVVKRSSGGEFVSGWEVCDVPDRTYIMVHVANKVSELLGCIGLGDRFGAIGGRWAVLNSRKTFALFMGALSGSDEHILIVRRHVLGQK